jgi:hypothetical protein
MLRRARKLRAIFLAFSDEWERPDLVLDNEEWRQIDYLLHITHPFYEFTTELSRTRDVTVHYTFKMYNLLFDHIDGCIRQLTRKRVPWKKKMHAALEASWAKLKHYYSKTDSIPGDLYAVSTMLSPVDKYAFFLTENWEPQYCTQYRQSFKDALRPYQDHDKDQQSSPTAQPSSRKVSRLDMILNKSTHRLNAPKNEMAEYLDSGMYFHI